ncbi:MAG: hypothetical protein ABI699_10730 [Caldimonas sp.]
MRGSPCCAVTVARFEAWRGAIFLVAAASLASLAVWLATSALSDGAWTRAAIAMAAAVVVALSVSLLRRPALVLRWNGFEWSVQAAGPGAPPPASGQMEVALDLGSFLLLRFVAQAGANRAAPRWIPVGRRGLEREWHAFRCAVYSPRPAAGPSAADPRLP